MSERADVLHEMLAKVAKEQGYENGQISTMLLPSEGANYTSYLYQASISAPNKEDLKLFVKVAASGEKMRKVALFRVFDVESIAYNELLETYKNLEDKHNVSKEHRLVTPKFYGNTNEYLREAIVLEDLTVAGYTTYDRCKSVDWEYASKSIQSLAKLHALSIAWSVEDPEEFEKTGSKIKMTESLEGLSPLLKILMSNAVEVTREENKERISKFVQKLNEDIDCILQFFKPVRRPVIAHGDYRPSNTMLRINEDDTVQVIPIDYQSLQKGNPIIDLMFFIYNGSDKNFRDKHLTNLLDFYYQELCSSLQRLHLEPDQIYPREDFDFELQEILPFGLIVAMIWLVLVTVDTQNAPKVSKDIGIEDFALTPNSLYKKRLNDIIDDFIDMGLI